MNAYCRKLAWLSACAALALGVPACWGSSDRGGDTGAAGTTGAAGDSGPGAGGATGSAGSAGTTTGRGGTTGSAGTTGTGGAVTVPPGGLFTSLLGKTTTDVDTKVTTAVNRFFGIGTNEPTTPTRDSGYRCYYELPQDASMAFIWAADSDDVRSEGMSYGMMIAVQMNMQPQFDRLWKFAKTYMQFPASSAVSAWRYYFKWQGTVNRSNATSWTATFSDAT